MARTLNFRMTGAEVGAAVFRGMATGDSLNSMGSVYGGRYGTVLCSALGWAVRSTLAAGRIYTTLDYKVNLVRAVLVGTEIEARGTVRHSGRRTATATADLRGMTDGRLNATGTATCLIMTP